MALSAYAPIPPPVNDGATALDHAAAAARPAPANANVPVATPSAPVAAPAVPAAVSAILAQPDPSFDAFWSRMVPGESGGKDVPNYRYDPTHTASGTAQITDTNWRAQAPKLGIDVRRYPTAMSAPLPYQKAVAKLMHREYGPAPWDAAHGGSLPVGNGSGGAQRASTELNATARGLGEQYHRELQRDLADAQRQMEEYGRLAAAQPPGSAEADRLLQQQFDASSRAADLLDKLAKAPPVFTPLTPLQNFGSLATVVAIFGGLMSKQPITAALNAAGTAMKAANQQNWKEYETAYNTWRAQTDLAVQSIRAHSAEINDILNNKRLGFDEQQAQLRALYAKFGMTTALAKLQQGDVEFQYQMATTMPQIAAKLEETKAQIEALNAKSALERAQAGITQGEMQMFGGGPAGAPASIGTSGAPPPSAAPSPAAAGQVHADAAAAIGGKAPPAPVGTPDWAWDAALIYVKTGKMPSLGFGSQMTGLAKIAVLSSVPKAMAALGISATDVPQQWAEYRALEHGEMALGSRAAALAVGIGEAGAAAPAVIQASENVPRTALGPVFNSIITGSEFQSGDPRIVRFHAALNTFLNAYARAINPSGHMTDQQQRHAYETLDTAMSKGQIAAGVDQLLQELKYMRAGLGEAVGTVGGLLKPGGSGGEAAEPREPVPPAYSGDPDGTTYHKSGKTWIKEGNFLVQQP